MEQAATKPDPGLDEGLPRLFASDPRALPLPRDARKRPRRSERRALVPRDAETCGFICMTCMTCMYVHRLRGLGTSRKDVGRRQRLSSPRMVATDTSAVATQVSVLQMTLNASKPKARPNHAQVRMGSIQVQPQSLEGPRPKLEEVHLKGFRV